MGHLGMPELLAIIVLVLLVFGAKKVPEIFRSLGSGVSEFKRGLSDGAKPEQQATGEKPPTEPKS